MSVNVARAHVEAVYEALLNRELDDGGADKVERLATGDSSLADILREVLGSTSTVRALPYPRRHRLRSAF